MAVIIRFCNDRRGATAIEYALIAGLVSIAIVTTAGAAGTSLQGVYASLSSKISDALAP